VRWRRTKERTQTNEGTNVAALVWNQVGIYLLFRPFSTEIIQEMTHTGVIGTLARKACIVLVFSRRVTEFGMKVLLIFSELYQIRREILVIPTKEFLAYISS